MGESRAVPVMHDVTFLSRIRRGAVAALTGLALAALQACGSSSTSVSSVTSPTSVNRCAITMQPVEGPLPSDGGSAAIAVTAARECAWSASVDGAWLSLKSGGSGQGDGTVEFAASANPDPVMRRGAIVANGQRAEISQSAGECGLSLAQSSAGFSQSGGSGQVQVRASSGMCSWSAAADAEWVQIRNGSGQGNGTVNFDIRASSGPPRSATINVSGQKFSIIQSEGCTYAINPASIAAGPSGTTAPIAITAAANCPWTASSNVSWLTLSPASGTGPASVSVTVAATAGKSRTGTAVVAGHSFSVSQSQGCSYNVQPATTSVGAGGGTVTVSIASNPECDWSATSNDSWITIQGRSSGTGAGTVTFAAAATTGPSRSGSAVVAGQTITISQTPGCSFTISPESASVPASAATGKVSVSTGTGCSWTASSSASWLTITSGSNGSGSGEVHYSAAAVTGPARSATLTIAGRTFTLNQGDGCAFSLSANSANIDDNGGQGTFNVQAAGGCGWTASSAVPWITISSGASGSGSGTVRFTVAANNGPPRSGAITAGGQTFTVQQGNGCSYSLSAAGQNVPAAGGSGSVNVSSSNGCGWTATSNANWLTVTSGANGSGNGSVGFTAAAHTGASRQGTLTIAGKTFTVDQGSGCSFTINPAAHTMPATGGSVTVSVGAAGSCPWTASSNASWLAVVTGASGSGPGAVQVDAQANSGAPRSGTVTIAGQTLTVSQDSGCTFTVSPETIGVPAAGGPGHIDVTGAPSCAWTASSAGWITIVSAPGGNGNGGIDLTIAANSGPARSGTLLVAGRTVTVNQDSGCTITLGAPSTTAPAGGGPGTVAVSSAGGCPWTATSNAPWITVTGGSPGSGDGTVTFNVEANTTGAPRSGTIAIGGAGFTINQQ
jgi:hypothetical protein